MRRQAMSAILTLLSLSPSPAQTWLPSTMTTPLGPPRCAGRLPAKPVMRPRTRNVATSIKSTPVFERSANA
jgi:hypothetical protein